MKLLIADLNVTGVARAYPKSHTKFSVLVFYFGECLPQIYLNTLTVHLEIKHKLWHFALTFTETLQRENVLFHSAV